MRPLLLDLFCCAGGAAKGYEDAGFDVFGVDVVEQPRYPYPMMVADAMTLPPAVFDQFDAIHASPPCQAYSDLAARNGNADEWPDLIEPVRDMLNATGKPYVIENVEGAPLRDYVVLCGTIFHELRVLRHRLFESNFNIVVPPHRPHPLCHTLDKRKAHYGKTDLTFPSRRKAVFVHGCFWHGHADCRRARPPSSNRDFWLAKLKRNRERDERNLVLLQESGWGTMVVWECELADLDAVALNLINFLE